MSQTDASVAAGTSYDVVVARSAVFVFPHMVPHDDLLVGLGCWEFAIAQRDPHSM